MKPKIIGIGNRCNKCGTIMERKCHKAISFKQLKQPYIFAYWDVCPKCRMVQLYDNLKIYINL